MCTADPVIAVPILLSGHRGSLYLYTLADSAGDVETQLVEPLKRGPVEPVQSRRISDPGLGKSLTIAVLLSHGRPSQQFPEADQRHNNASPVIFLVGGNGGLSLG
jgi:hypothetical protein